MEEESAVGEHQANGEVENAIQRTQGHFRTVRLALEARYKRRIRGDHHVLPWMLRYVIGMMNRVQVGRDGWTSYRRLKGKEFKRDGAEFGECVMYMVLESEGRDKGESRWREGVFLGFREESGEVFMGTKEGVVKARTMRRFGTEAARWNVETFGAFVGVPWEPVPGRGEVEVEPQIREEREDFGEAMEGETKEQQVRRIKISRNDIKKFWGHHIARAAGAF